MIDLQKLSDARILGEEGEQREFKRDSPLQDVGELVTAYNEIMSAPVRLKHWQEAGAELLDMVIVKAGLWLTSKPPRQTDTNRARWAGLKDLIEQATRESRTLGFRMLTSPSDFKTISGEKRSYWLERIDPKHRPGYLLAEHFQPWLISSSDLSFFEWFDVFGPSSGGVRYLKRKMDREQYRVKFVRDLLIGPDGNPFDTRNMTTAFSGRGWAIFVCSKSTQKIYAHSHIEGHFHHSTFLKGQPVLAAGELCVEEGKVRMITAKSGHYMPSVEDMWNFVRTFEPRAGTVIRPRFGPPPIRIYSCREFKEKGLFARPLTKEALMGQKNFPKWARDPEKTKWLGMIEA